MLVRNLPFQSTFDVLEMLQDSYDKEYEAAINTYHPTTFNWDALFTYHPIAGSADFHPDYHVDPSLHSRISICMNKAKERLQGIYLYPDYSTKTLGRETSSHYESLCEYVEHGPKENTTLGLERFENTHNPLSR